MFSRFSTLGARRLSAAAGVAVLASVASAALAIAEEGITGRVVSAETGQPVGFTSIVYSRTAPDTTGPRGGITAQGDGTFRIRVTPGTYQLQLQHIGFAVVTVSDIVVQANRMTEVNPALGSKTVTLETIKVSGKAIRNTDMALIARRQRAASVSDGISAQQIKGSTDGNAAEVVTRVTGVSLVDGKYVYVRGLGERYSAAQVNGTPVASPEANRKVLPFDLFPSGLIDNVVIQKTYTPDQAGEFGGGVVNVTTLDFPAQRAWSVSVSSGSQSETTGKAFATYPGGRRDYLGFDDGTRALPSLITEVAGAKPVLPKTFTYRNGFTPDQIAELGKSFNKIWSPTSENARPAYEGALSYGDQFDILGMPLGIVAAGSLRNTFHNYDYHVTDYGSLTSNGTLSKLNDFAARRSQAETLLGGLVNMGWRLSSSHTLNLRGMYNRSSDDQVRVEEGPTSDLPIRSRRLRYVQRGLVTGSAGMTHHLARLGASQLDWHVDYSQAEQDEPDQRSYTYELRTRVDAAGDTTNVYELSRRTKSAGFVRMFGQLHDFDRNFAANLDVPFEPWAGRESHAKIGWAMRDKDRVAETRRLAFRNPQIHPPDYSLPPDSLLTDASIGGTNSTFRLEEATRPTDGYVGSQLVQAGYAMVDLPLGSRTRLIGGARVEACRQVVKTGNPIVGAPADSVGILGGGFGYVTDVLPAANVRFAVTEKVNLRGAYSRTLNRPELREMSGAEYTDYDRDREYTGNTKISEATIDGWDLRCEAFPSADEVLAVSAFLKNIHDPIEYKVDQTALGTDFLRVPINGTQGYVRGVELEARVAMARLGSAFHHFGFSTNVTFTKSEAELAIVSTRGGRVRHPLTGQSPYIVNAGMAYAGHRLSGTLLYNIFGKRLEASGPVDENGNPLMPDVYEQPRHTLDVAGTVRWGAAKLKLSFENLLDAKYRTAQGSQDGEVRDLGRSISLALSMGTS